MIRSKRINVLQNNINEFILFLRYELIRRYCYVTTLLLWRYSLIL